MTWLDAVKAAIIIINWLKTNPPSDKEVTQEQLEEANAKMKAAIEKWEEV